MRLERVARVAALMLVLGLPVSALAVRAIQKTNRPGVVEISGRMAEDGGWTPDEIVAEVGEPITFRLKSEDVMHGFAIGRVDVPAVDMKPGEITETTVTFSHPGKYVFYCTRWCGPDHWRMRGTIEVRGGTADTSGSTPLYQSLGIDLDAAHPASMTPERTPIAQIGEDTRLMLEPYDREYYRSHSPAETWHRLRRDSTLQHLTDMDIWNLVATVWALNTSDEILEQGESLYVANCAACHGETGAGNGVMAPALERMAQTELGRDTKTPADFTDASTMLGASPALLQGKIVRGGMGTGMPYWGPIFTDAQLWALVGYLQSFQFERVSEDTAR